MNNTDVKKRSSGTSSNMEEKTLRNTSKIEATVVLFVWYYLVDPPPQML